METTPYPPLTGHEPNPTEDELLYVKIHGGVLGGILFFVVITFLIGQLIAKKTREKEQAERRKSFVQAKELEQKELPKQQPHQPVQKKQEVQKGMHMQMTEIRPHSEQSDMKKLPPAYQSALNSTPVVNDAKSNTIVAEVHNATYDNRAYAKDEAKFKVVDESIPSDVERF